MFTDPKSPLRPSHDSAAPHRAARPIAVPALVCAAAIAGALTSGVPTANATAVVYRDGHDVHLATPDGTRRRQVTTDGTATAAHTLPSADDAGNVVSFQRVPGSSSSLIVWSPIGGGAATKNVMPWRISSGINAGPTWARVRARGGLVAYGYLLNTGIGPGGSITPRLAIVDPRAPGSPTSPAIDQPNVLNGSWRQDQLIVSDGAIIRAEQQPLDFGPWLQASEALTAAEVARDGSRALVHASSGGLELVTLTGGAPPLSTPTAGCTIAPAGDDRYSGTSRAALSADGRRVAWSDSTGVHVATVATVPDGVPCPLSERVRLSPTGGMPSFTEYTLPTDPGPGPGPGGDPGPDGDPPPGDPVPGGDPGPGGGPPPGGGPGPTGKPTGGGAPGGKALTIATPKLRLGKLRRGQVVTVRAGRAGRVRLHLLRGKRRIATATATARRAGRVRLTLRLNRAGRRARGLAGRTVTLRATLTSSTGRAVKATRKVRLRR
ncbi:MAG: hypothetical protein AB7G37_04560 [Solirubrobacteraceae bacterium]